VPPFALARLIASHQRHGGALRRERVSTEKRGLRLRGTRHATGEWRVSAICLAERTRFHRLDSGGLLGAYLGRG
jgi:hypothetical protein